MDLTADLAVFFGDWAGDVSTIKGQTFPGIFDAEYAAAFDNPSVDSTAPALTCKTADLARFEVVLGTTLIVRDTNGDVLGSFAVRSQQPDGTGITILRLEEV